MSRRNKLRFNVFLKIVKRKSKIRYKKTYPDITCNKLVVSSDSHLLPSCIGDFEQSSKV